MQFPIGHVARQIKGLPPQLANLLAGAAAVWFPTVTTHVGPSFRQRNCDRGAQAPAGAGDQRILAVQLESFQDHACFLTANLVCGDPLSTNSGRLQPGHQ